MFSKHVFGPVPSRRLGQSLGIDPVPLKTCNWNCVYCQLGRTKPFVTERQNFFEKKKILSQVKAALDSHKPGEIDWVTFVGSGETSLHAGLGEMVREVQSMTDLPIAVITNGSLLYLPEVREALITADAVMPSLDAGNAKLYRKINRPHRELTFERLISGLKDFRETYKNQLWIEVMLIQGINDGKSELEEIASLLKQIKPDEVHIVKPDRPPAEAWVNPPDDESLMSAHAILGKVAKIIHPALGTFDFSSEDNLVDAIVNIITRHPMRENELTNALTHWSTSDVHETLEALEKSGRAQVVIRHDVRFWSASESRYPNN
jgi:wyosine [tRNA(Phe)-imidazoG37] synthetase (radical SAM superfamily)